MNFKRLQQQFNDNHLLQQFDAIDSASCELLVFMLTSPDIKPKLYYSNLSAKALAVREAIQNLNAYVVSKGIDLDAEPTFMLNKQGFEIPLDKVDALDQSKDALVYTLVNKARLLSKWTKSFKEMTFSRINDFRAEMFDKYAVEVGGTNGNIQIASYDQRMRIIVGVAEQITFGPEIDVAKTAIKQVADSELQGNESKLILEIVTEAFQADKQGQYSKSKILALRKHKNASQNPDWQKAMRAIDDAIISSDSKTYVRYQERNKQGAWITIPLTSQSL